MGRRKPPLVLHDSWAEDGNSVRKKVEDDDSMAIVGLTRIQIKKKETSIANSEGNYKTLRGDK